MVAVPLGVFAAIHRNSWFDNLVYVVATAIGSVPTFWVGLLAIILFAVKFQEWGFRPPGRHLELPRRDWSAWTAFAT